MKWAFMILTLLTQVVFAVEDDLDKKWTAYEKSIESNFESMTNLNKKAWDQYQKQVGTLWGHVEKESPKTLIEHSKNNHVRVSINYETGEVVAEALKDKDQPDVAIKKQIQESLTSLIKNSSDSSAEIKQEEISLDGKSVQDYLSTVLKTLDQRGQIIGNDGEARDLYRLQFQLVPDLIQRRARAVYPLVKKWSARYSLDPAFVLAIIRQESAFNPKARSWVPAYGLMQIVPQYAGQEVVKSVFGQRFLPSAEMLYDTEKNIMMGTTYLQILRDKYFSTINDGIKKQFLITCGYNWGPARLQKAIENGRLKMASAKEIVFSRLISITPPETSQYLKKVTKFHSEFKKMIDEGKLGV